MSWVLFSVLILESKVFSILGMLSNTELHARGNMCSINYRYSKKVRSILGPFASQSFTVRRLGQYKWGLGILCSIKERSKSQSIQGWRPGILMALLTKCWVTLSEHRLIFPVYFFSFQDSICSGTRGTISRIFQEVSVYPRTLNFSTISNCFWELQQKRIDNTFDLI